MFRKWFFGAEFDDVLKRGNLEKWLAWAFFNKEIEEFSQEELDDLHLIIQQFEVRCPTNSYIFTLTMITRRQGRVNES